MYQQDHPQNWNHLLTCLFHFPAKVKNVIRGILSLYPSLEGLSDILAYK